MTGIGPAARPGACASWAFRHRLNPPDAPRHSPAHRPPPAAKNARPKTKSPQAHSLPQPWQSPTPQFIPPPAPGHRGSFRTRCLGRSLVEEHPECFVHLLLAVPMPQLPAATLSPSPARGLHPTARRDVRAELIGAPASTTKAQGRGRPQQGTGRSPILHALARGLRARLGGLVPADADPLGLRRRHRRGLRLLRLVAGPVRSACGIKQLCGLPPSPGTGCRGGSGQPHGTPPLGSNVGGGLLTDAAEGGRSEATVADRCRAYATCGARLMCAF